MLAWRGAVKWLLGGNTIPISDETFKAIGQGYIPGGVGLGGGGRSDGFVLFMAMKSAPSVKQYGLGEADYKGQF